MAPVFLQLTERSTSEVVWVNLSQVLYIASANKGLPEQGSVLFLPANQVFVTEAVEKVMEAIRGAVETVDAVEAVAAG